jgi:hypothetical protein
MSYINIRFGFPQTILEALPSPMETDNGPIWNPTIEQAAPLGWRIYDGTDEPDEGYVSLRHEYQDVDGIHAKVIVAEQRLQSEIDAEAAQARADMEAQAAKSEAEKYSAFLDAVLPLIEDRIKNGREITKEAVMTAITDAKTAEIQAGKILPSPVEPIKVG